MTNLMTRIVVLSAVLFGAPMMAQANGKMLSPEQMERHVAAQQAKAARLDRIREYHKNMRDRDVMRGIHSGRKASVVPELDPSAGGSAAVLVAGGALVLLGRRRRQLAE